MKSQNEFLFALEEELKYLKPKEIHEIMKHYQEKISVAIDYGESEAKVIGNLPSPHYIAAEIYKSRGIAFLDIRKKRYRKKEIWNAIGSGLLFVVIVLCFTGIMLLVVPMFFNMASLLGMVFSFQIADIICTGFFIVAYLVIIFLATIYIFDLFYNLGATFLVKVLRLSPKFSQKEFGFQHFMISKFLSNKIKVAKLPLKIMGIAALVMLFFGIAGFATKGYVYRSLMDKPGHETIYTYEEWIEKLEFIDENAYVKIIMGDFDQITIKHQYEFSRNFAAKIADKSLTFSLTKSKSYDLFELLKEPTQQLTIEVPRGTDLKSLKIRLDRGSITIEDIASQELNIDCYIYNGGILISNSMVNEIKAEINNGKIISNKNHCTGFFITSARGMVTSLEDHITSLHIINGSSGLAINKADIETCHITNQSGSVLLSEISGKEFNFQSKTSMNQLNDMEYDKMTVEMNFTGSLTLKRIIVHHELIANIQNAYLTLDYIQSPSIQINGDIATLSIYHIGRAIEKEPEALSDFEKNYNAQEYLSTFSVKNQKGKMTLTYCFFANMEIAQNSGAILIENTQVENTKIVLNDVNVTIRNLYGKVASISLTKSYLSFYNDETTAIIVRIPVYAGGSQMEIGMNITVEGKE